MREEEAEIVFVFAGSNDHQASFSVLRATGAVEFHKHIGDDVVGHYALAGGVSLQANVKRHVQQPELHVGISEADGAIKNGLALAHIDVGVIDDYVETFS